MPASPTPGAWTIDDASAIDGSERVSVVQSGFDRSASLDQVRSTLISPFAHVVMAGNETATNITATSTWTLAAGVVADHADAIQDFTVDDEALTLTYDGTATARFIATAWADLDGTADETIDLAFVAGTATGAITSSYQSATLNGSGTAQAIGFTGYFSLATDATISVYARNTSSDADVTVTALRWTMAPLGTGRA